ncbi:hypothetical protein ACFLZM_07895 [Thermodesulfobacteriota bacterium]
MKLPVDINNIGKTGITLNKRKVLTFIISILKENVNRGCFPIDGLITVENRQSTTGKEK